MALTFSESRMITFLCLNCGGVLKVSAALAGRIGQCSHCGHWMQVPHYSADGLPAASPSRGAFVLLCSFGAILLLALGGGAGFYLGRLSATAWEPAPAQIIDVVPSKPPLVALAEWQDVSQSATQGEIEVNWRGAAVRYVAALRESVIPTETSDQTPLMEESEDLWKHKELVLSIRIQNRGAQPFPYTHPGREGTKLIDNQGNLFRQTYENGTRIKGQIAQTVIAPGQAVDDLLVFSCSYVGKGDQLLLELPAQSFGGQPQTKIKLKMDQKLIAK